MPRPAELPRHPVWPTLLVVILSAIGAVFIGAVLVFAGSLVTASAAGPVGLLVAVPLAMAILGNAMAVGVFAAPVWAIFGGGMLSLFASGKRGAQGAFGITLFSETHPISKVTRTLSDRMGIDPVRWIGWYPSEDINAFAMGTDNQNMLIGLSKGAIEKLTKQELIAVIAHELGHVASQDTVRMTYARSMVEALTFFLVFRRLKRLARWVFLPVSELELLRFSRQREFTADKIAASVTRPEWMIDALLHVQREKDPPVVPEGYEPVMFWSRIVDKQWLRTHPPLEDRIAALEQFSQAKAGATARGRDAHQNAIEEAMRNANTV
ncbi:MAG: M48 family metalloprotease [Hyphomonas sp.]|nr:M48 family metalloprotease [Hyphomonas sp.]